MWAQDSFWQMYTKCLVSARHCIRRWGCTSEQDKAPTLWSLYSSEGVGREEEPSKQSHYDCVKALKKRDNKWKVVEMVPLNRMVWEELPEEKAQVEKRRSQSWEYSKTVVQAQRARVKLQRQEMAAIFEEQNGAPWCSWIPPPVRRKKFMKGIWTYRQKSDYAVFCRPWQGPLIMFSEDRACGRRNMKYELEDLGQSWNLNHILVTWHERYSTTLPQFLHL